MLLVDVLPEIALAALVLLGDQRLEHCPSQVQLKVTTNSEPSTEPYVGITHLSAARRDAAALHADVGHRLRLALLLLALQTQIRRAVEVVQAVVRARVHDRVHHPKTHF